MTRQSLFVAACLFAAASHSLDAESRTWDFRVFLDETPIGQHRFALRTNGDERELSSTARFDVKVLGFTAYRYAHEATEHWRGGCIGALTARTDDNGERSDVKATREAERLAVSGPRARDPLGGCVLTFAYWNPAILRESRLLNVQTGEYEAVAISSLGEETITVRGAPVKATHYRIAGPKQPIDLWYSAQRDWLQLESTVAGGRRLRYRLQ